jgi:hypothetical protein
VKTDPAPLESGLSTTRHDRQTSTQSPRQFLSDFDLGGLGYESYLQNSWPYLTTMTSRGCREQQVGFLQRLLLTAEYTVLGSVSVHWRFRSKRQLYFAFKFYNPDDMHLIEKL